MFKIGDRVKLTTGGRMMAVTAIDERDGVMFATCLWRVDGKDETGRYPVEVLMSAAPLTVNRGQPGGSWGGSRTR